MRSSIPEPGLLRTFRFYVVLRMCVMGSVGFVYYLILGFALETKQLPYMLLFLGNIVFLFGYLSMPWLRRQLGKYYLPLALIIAAVGPILETRYITDVYDAGYAIRLWMVFPFLSVPLILTAWQYSMRDVTTYCLGTAGLEILFISTSINLAPLDMMMDVFGIIARSVFFVLLGYIVNGLVDAQRKQRHELAQANLKLIRYASTLEQLTTSRERNRLARELHDTLAHTLSGLAVQLEAIITIWHSAPERACSMLERALTTTRVGLDATRRALRDLRAAPPEDLGLALAIRSLAESAAARNSFALELDVPEHLREISPEIEHGYYRIAQEALENVAQHAGASLMRISLRQTDDRLTLEVSDDGTGFNVETVEAQNRYGLRGIRERAEMIGAELVVRSSSNEGTMIRLEAEST
ncbi:MAG: sensor histidine kinase [Anaerolineae bacterium]|nr:sensor histidine kinase [Anaerolineae bacterium]